MNIPEIRNNEILAPETIEVRDKIIDKFGDKPLIEMNEFVKNFLRSETDPLNELGAMAARVYILRHRISIVASEKFDDKEALITEVKIEETGQKSKIMERSAATEFAEDLGEWVRLRIVGSSEVNGVRFPEGVIIDVKNSDALKLLRGSKKAVIEETPAEEVPPKAEETPAEEAKAEETPAEGPKKLPPRKAEETPAEEVKAEETPAEEAKAEETPAEEAKAEETPAEEAKAEETPAEEVKAEETPAEEAKAEETPAEEVKAEETPAEEAVDELSALMQEIEEKNSSSDQKK